MNCPSLVFSPLRVTNLALQVSALPANRTLCLTGFLRLCDDVRPTSFSHVDPRPVVITLI
jgi:hypothetical protein